MGILHAHVHTDAYTVGELRDDRGEDKRDKGEEDTRGFRFQARRSCKARTIGSVSTMPNFREYTPGEAGGDAGTTWNRRIKGVRLFGLDEPCNEPPRNKGCAAPPPCFAGSE